MVCLQSQGVGATFLDKIFSQSAQQSIPPVKDNHYGPPNTSSR